MFLRVTRNFVFFLVPDKFTISTLWNPCNWFDTGQDVPQLIFGDAYRKYICSFNSNHNEQRLSNFTISCSGLLNHLRLDCSQYATRRAEELRPRYFLVFHVTQKGCYILGLTDISCTIVYSYSLTEVWDPGHHLLVNSYISKIIKNKIDGVDSSDILLQADKGGTNDSPVEGSNHFWFCLRPTTQYLALVTLEPLSSYSVTTGGQTLCIEFSVGYCYNASKGLYIAEEVHLLVLYVSFDVKHEDYAQCDYCCKEAEPYQPNYSMPWSPLSSLICIQNERCIAVCYPEKAGVKLPFPSTDVFPPSNLAEQMIVLWIIFRTVDSFSLSIHWNNGPIRESVEMLVIPGSSPLPRIDYLPPGDVIENLQVLLPSIRYHIARNFTKQMFRC